MIFFVPAFVIGLMNFAVPLRLGADVAFPVLNSVSFWLTATSAAGQHRSSSVSSRVGWLPYPPLRGWPAARVARLLLWALQIRVGTSTGSPADCAARPRHDLPAHADLLLTTLASNCLRRPFPTHRHPGDAHRPLSRLPLFTNEAGGNR
jgi:hypothetical protein